jgi:hypothetical protein
MTQIHLTATAAKYLLDPEKRRLIASFGSSPKTITEFSHDVGLRLNLAAYYTNRFVKLGLLKLDSDASARDKRYMLSADEFVVAFANTSFTNLGEMLSMMTHTDQVTANTLQSLSHDWCIIFARQPNAEELELTFSPLRNGEPQPIYISDLLTWNKPAFFVSGESLTLSYEQAKALQQELVSLVSKYRGINNTCKGHNYVFQLCLAPLTNPAKES